MATTTRIARRSDLDRLVAIEDATFDAARYGRMSRRQFAMHLKSPRAVVIVVEKDGDVVGYALGFLHAQRRQLRFYSLAVAPEAQGGEAGRALFAAIEEAARERGLAVQCEVRADNEKLRARYAALGYRQYREVGNYYPDGASCLKFVKLHP